MGETTENERGEGGQGDGYGTGIQRTLISLDVENNVPVLDVNGEKVEVDVGIKFGEGEDESLFRVEVDCDESGCWWVARPAEPGRDYPEIRLNPEVVRDDE